MPNHLMLKTQMLKAIKNFDQEATRDGIFLVDGVAHGCATIARENSIR